MGLLGKGLGSVTTPTVEESRFLSGIVLLIEIVRLANEDLRPLLFMYL